MLVAFVAPFLQPNTLRYVRALSDIEGVRLALLSCDTADRLAAVAPDLLGRVRMVRVARSLDAQAMADAVRLLPERPGRLLGMLEQLQLPLAEARAALGIPGMGPAAALAFRDKDRMKQVLAAAGLPVARHRRLESLDAGRDAAAALGFPLILKPVAGVGSRSTFRISDDDDLRAALAHLQPSPSRPVQVEEFVVGVERTLEMVFVDGRPVWWSGTRYHPSPLRVLENRWMQYTVTLPAEPCAPWTAFAPTAAAALQALGLRTGLAHMEWFETPDGRFVIGEVGARPPGVNIMPLMSQAFDTDMVDAWCRLMVCGTWPSPERVRAAGSAFFRGQGRGQRVVAVRGIAEAHEAVGALVVDRKLPQVGQAPTTSYTGEGWAIVSAPSTREVTSALGTLVRTVRVDLG
ncbi:MAG: ATP-grasp domain-containing protein [Myxococcota bacterium]|nr:ATP-grasp domain-containing protein [Myxococcota bacterium]